MQVGTGRSILNGIAIGKLKIYKKKDTVISTAEIADTAAEVARFEAAQQKAIEQQTALYEKALAEAGEDIAEVFNIHAMMLEDDDFVDAIKEIINGQHKCAEYAVKTAGDNQAAVFAAMDDPYLQARSADVIDIAQAILDILQGVDNASLQGTEPSILVAEDLAPSETVRMDALLAWAETKTAPPKSSLGKALYYLREQWPYLKRYLEDGRLEISNNRAERSMKPFVMGRKNWLFANTEGGAQSSAIVYSLIETAKENGLDPYRYLVYVLFRAPSMAAADRGWSARLTPDQVPAQCRMAQEDSTI